MSRLWLGWFCIFYERLCGFIEEWQIRYSIPGSTHSSIVKCIFVCIDTLFNIPFPLLLTSSHFYFNNPIILLSFSAETPKYLVLFFLIYQTAKFFIHFSLLKRGIKSSLLCWLKWRAWDYIDKHYVHNPDYKLISLLTRFFL